MKIKLTKNFLLTSVNELTTSDKILARVINRFGPPPMWKRKPGFSTLIKIILEQQVSLASAESLFNRLDSKVPEINPVHIEKLSVNGLRKLGFTHQKANYCHGLAEIILSRTINLERISRMDDTEAYNSLLKIKGVRRGSMDVEYLSAYGTQAPGYLA